MMFRVQFLARMSQMRMRMLLAAKYRIDTSSDLSKDRLHDARRLSSSTGMQLKRGTMEEKGSQIALETKAKYQRLSSLAMSR
jgi:hypothetical protein